MATRDALPQEHRGGWRRRLPISDRRGRPLAVRVRRADGRPSSRRGYTTRAAAVAARRELIDMVRADVRATDPSQFDAFFKQIVREKRAYLTMGALEDLASHGRIRLI